MIKDIVGKESEWITDKKGIKLRQLVIQPLVNLVEELIQKYSADAENNDDRLSKRELDKKMKATTNAIGVLDYISSKNLEEDISTYLSPRFGLNKN